MKVLFKKMKPNAKKPLYGSEFAAGCDLYACINETVEIAPGDSMKISTGIGIELPNNMVGLVFARSGLSTKRDLAPSNKVGVIDSDYRGEIIVFLHNHGKKVQKIEPDERIAQLVIVPYFQAEFEEVEELSISERNTNGFGSTGTK